MADYYISSAGNDSNDGSIGSPWLTLSKAQSTVSANDTIYLNKGDSWRELFTVPQNGITIDAYGSGDAPVISGAVDQSSGWTTTGIGAWWYIVSSDLGLVLEDGAPLTFIEWDTDFPTTTAGATAGSYTYWIGANILYVWTSDGTDPGTHTIDVATRNYCIDVDTKDNVTIQNINVEMAAIHNIRAENADSLTVDTVTTQKCGSKYVTSLYIGNGLEIGNGCTNFTVSNVTYDHIFDSGVSAQTYTTNGVSISGGAFTNVTGKRAGYSGIEVAVTGSITDSYIENITITNPQISATGYGFSGQRYGNKANGIHLETPSATGSSYLKGITITGGRVYNNVGNGIFGLENLGLVSITKTVVYGNLLDSVVIGGITDPNTLGLDLKQCIVYNTVGHGVFYANSDGQRAQIDDNVIVYNGNTANTKYNILFTDINTAVTNTFRRNICAGSLAYALAVQFTNANMVMDQNKYIELGTAKIASFNSVEYDTADVASYRTATGREAQTTFGSAVRARLCVSRAARSTRPAKAA